MRENSTAFGGVHAFFLIPSELRSEGVSLGVAGRRRPPNALQRVGRQPTSRDQPACAYHGRARTRQHTCSTASTLASSTRSWTVPILPRPSGGRSGSTPRRRRSGAVPRTSRCTSGSASRRRGSAPPLHILPRPLPPSPPSPLLSPSPSPFPPPPFLPTVLASRAQMTTSPRQKCANRVYTRSSYPNYFTCGKACPKGQPYCRLCTERDTDYRETCLYCGSEYGRRSARKCSAKFTAACGRNLACGQRIVTCNACGYSKGCVSCEEGH